MGLFGATHGLGWGGRKAPVPKICHTYPTMMKLGTVITYLKKIQKIYKSHTLTDMWHTLSVLLKSAFFTENQPLFLYQEIRISTAF